MSRSDESIPPPECSEYPAPLSPQVPFFRHVALLQVPVGWRSWLLHLGIALFDWSLETWGIAHEEKSSLAITGRRMMAIGSDLRTSGEQLASLGEEPDGSEMSRAEKKLCKEAGKLAPTVLELATKLYKTVTG